MRSANSSAIGINAISTLVAWSFGARMLRKVIPSATLSKIFKGGGVGARKLAAITLKPHVAKLPDSDPDIKKFKQIFDKYSQLGEGPEKEAALQEMKDISNGLTKKVKGLYKDKSLIMDTGKIATKAEFKAIKGAAGIIENTVKGVSVGEKVVDSLGKVGGFLMGKTPLSAIAETVMYTAGEGASEWWRRNKALQQAVLLMPVTYQGRQYTAGINGHKGMVVGDSMGKYDSFLSGMGFDSKSSTDPTKLDTWGEWLIDGVNWLTGADAIDYSVTEEDLQNMIYDKTK
jgi:hypothetical protein